MKFKKMAWGWGYNHRECFLSKSSTILMHLKLNFTTLAVVTTVSIRHHVVKCYSSYWFIMMLMKNTEWCDYSDSLYPSNSWKAQKALNWILLPVSLKCWLHLQILIWLTKYNNSNVFQHHIVLKAPPWADFNLHYGNNVSISLFTPSKHLRERLFYRAV